MAAQDPLDYLFSLEQYGIKLGLENIGRLCHALDHPERAFESVIVAGTNGKGSVAAMIDTALRRAGLTTGRFTSPHLVDLEERFVINGRAVSAATLTDQAAVLRTTIHELIESGQLDAPPTFFEATTAIAFALFRQAGIQMGVLEVGMGGRFDATNVVSPAAAVITTIDLDHQQYLGQTLKEIAFEKAGVIKPGTVVVTGETKPEALEVLRRACQERGARLVEAVTDVSTEVTVRNGVTELSLTTPYRAYEPITLSLRGHHQVTNATVAVRLLEELKVDIPESAIRAALSDTAWPGRLELAEVANHRSVVMDAAHNVAAARALGRYLTAEFPAGMPVVLASMRDKDVRGMLDALGPCATQIFCPTLRARRAWPAGGLAAIVSETFPELPVTVTDSAEAALEAAWKHSPIVCVAGSLYLVGDVRQTLATMRDAGRAPASVAG
jgi:dihydrofolate synthase/folylpolyglutamate synthase